MIDILGTLYTPGTYGPDLQVITPAVALPGYHVNTPEIVPEWGTFRVTPSTPRRVFGGNSTFFYLFLTEAEFLKQRKLANLDPANLDPIV